MWRRAPAGLGLTTRGRGLAVAAVAALLGDGLFGITELAALGAAALALLVACLLWVRSRQVALAVRREVRPQRCAAGQPVHVQLAVQNVGRGDTSPLVLRDGLDGRPGPESRLAPLGIGRSEAGRYRLAGLPRGHHLVGPLDVIAGDPFGLVQVARRIGTATTLLVHPVVERLTGLPSAAAGRSTAAGGAAPTASGDELHALRPYVAGDDLRRVHWPATARTGDLVIRQDEAEAEGRVDLAVDLRAAAHDAATLEAALSAAASIATAAARAGLATRLRSTGGLDTGWLVPDRLDTVLDALAAAAVHPGAGRRLGGFGDAGAAPVLVTTDALEAPAAVMAPAAAADTTVVVVERTGARRRRGEVRVRPGAALAPVWDARHRASARIGGR